MRRRLLIRILLFIISFAILSYVIFQTEPPLSWPQATTKQLLYFFIPFLFFFFFLINIFLNHLVRSFILSLCLLGLSVLQGLRSFDIPNITLIILTTLVLLLTIGKVKFRKPTLNLKKFKLPRKDEIRKLKPK